MTARTMPPSLPPAAPWYRQRWPWLLFAGPAIVVVAGLVTAWIAVVSDDGLIAEDYYKRGLLINKDLERTRQGDVLRMGAILRVAPGGVLTVESDAWRLQTATAATQLDEVRLGTAGASSSRKALAAT